jgi:hypothetical protein
MKSYLDRLNLRPMEKRLLVGVASMVFLVLNFWLVFPHFSDWGRLQFRMQKTQKKLASYQAEIDQIPTYKKRLQEMQSEGYAVPAEEQALHFANAVLTQQAQSGIPPGSFSKTYSKTNQFFLEQSQSIGVQCKEEQLVDFLFRLGSGNSLIRVRDFSLHPDPSRQQLAAQIKLVASYQKKQPARGAAVSAASTTPRSTAPAARSTTPPSTAKPAMPANRPAVPGSKPAMLPPKKP